MFIPYVLQLPTDGLAARRQWSSPDDLCQSLVRSWMKRDPDKFRGVYSIFRDRYKKCRFHARDSAFWHLSSPENGGIIEFIQMWMLA